MYEFDYVNNRDVNDYYKINPLLSYVQLSRIPSISAQYPGTDYMYYSNDMYNFTTKQWLVNTVLPSTFSQIVCPIDFIVTNRDVQIDWALQTIGPITQSTNYVPVELFSNGISIGKYLIVYENSVGLNAYYVVISTVPSVDDILNG